MKEILQQMVDTGGTCVNLGRVIVAKHIDLHNQIMNATNFLPVDCKYNERIYCILNDIDSRPFNEDGVTIARFVNLFEGYCIKKAPALPKEKKGRPPKFTKLQSFLSRNKRVNAELYLDSAIEGYDYVVCLHSNARVMIIRENYIKNTLNMSVEEYDVLYPGIKKTCDKYIDNVKSGIHAIDEETGMTKHALSTVKAKETLLKIDDNGLNGYEKKGRKTKETHMANVDEFGRNGYSQLASKAIVKGNETKAKKGMILPPEERTAFYRYKLLVTYLTERLRKDISKGYITGFAGVDGAWHIDHVYSIMNGFKNKVSPLVIGDIKNLNMIPWEENIEKHSKSGIKLEKLLEKVGYTMTESEDEYDFVMKCIRDDIKNNNTSTGAKIIGLLYEAKLSRKRNI